MLRTFLVFVAIKWRCEMMRIALAHETTRDLIRRYSFLGCGVNFDAVAGAEQYRLGTTGTSQCATGFRVSGETLARLDTGIVMNETDTKQIHGVCGCRRK